MFFGAIAVAILVLATGGWFVLFNSEGGTSGGGSGGGGSGGGGSSVEYVTDAAGREVQIPDDLSNGIVTVGSTGPLRFLSIFGVQDLVIEVDDGDATDPKNGRAYSYAYDFSNVATHPDNMLSAETVESIAQKNPSLVITQQSVYSGYRDLVDLLARTVTVIVINDQNVKNLYTADYKLADWYKQNVDIIGKALGMEIRAMEHVNSVEYINGTEYLWGVENIIADIRSLISESPSGVTYLAGVTFSGSNQLSTTFPVYLPLNLTGGNNAYTDSSTANKVDLSVEDAVGYIRNSDRILIDPSSADMLSENNSQRVLEYIYGLNNDADPDNDIPLYVGIPIVWDSVNYDCILAASYYLIYLQYGTLTYEQMLEKIESVFVAFYQDRGHEVFDSMCQFFESKCSQYNSEMPLLSEVQVVLENGTYTIRALGA